MATKLYLHEASYASANSDVGGTLPTTFRGAAATLTWSTATTLRSMDTTIGAGQTNAAQNSNGVATAEVDNIRMWATRPLASGVTFDIATDLFDVNIATSEANAAANWFCRSFNLYIWRPSTGAHVADMFNSTLPLTEAATSEEVRATSGGVSIASVTANTGDIIVAQFKDSYTQSMGVVYSRSMYYDGTTETATSGTGVSNHAAWINISNTLSFTSPPASSTLRALCLTGAGI